jgi:hypothetical protein
MNSTADLKNKVAMKLVAGNFRVIAAGPLTHQPHSLPYRIVMVDYGHELSVHTEIFDLDGPQVDLAKACETAVSHFHDGNYFKTEDFVKAAQRFAERLTADIRNHFGSIIWQAVA